MQAAFVLLIPFLGTSLGAAAVFFMKKEMNSGMEKILLGFAAGVMTAASVWSLLIPAIDMAQAQNHVAWFPAAVGFILGIVFLLLVDSLTAQLCKGSRKQGKGSFYKTGMMIFAVTLHNIPEGMAVGVTLAGALLGNMGISMAGAAALAVGIAIQNFPEGAIVSMPLRSKGMGRGRAFLGGVLSGAVEPVSGLVTVLLAKWITPVLPYFLSFAAGAMIHVVIVELIPESQRGEHSRAGMAGVTAGFVVMMVLDVALG